MKTTPGISKQKKTKCLLPVLKGKDVLYHTFSSWFRLSTYIFFFIHAMHHMLLDAAESKVIRSRMAKLLGQSAPCVLSPLSWRRAVWATVGRRWAGWQDRSAASWWCPAKPGSKADLHLPLPPESEERSSNQEQSAHTFTHARLQRRSRTSSTSATPFMGGVTSTETFVLLGMFLSALRKTERREWSLRDFLFFVYWMNNCGLIRVVLKLSTEIFSWSLCLQDGSYVKKQNMLVIFFF